MTLYVVYSPFFKRVTGVYTDLTYANKVAMADGFGATVEPVELDYTSPGVEYRLKEIYGEVK